MPGIDAANLQPPRPKQYYRPFFVFLRIFVTSTKFLPAGGLAGLGCAPAAGAVGRGRSVASKVGEADKRRLRVKRKVHHYTLK